MHINKYTFRLREIHHSIISYDTNLGKIYGKTSEIQQINAI